jgi:hypothetical protein
LDLEGVTGEDVPSGVEDLMPEYRQLPIFRQSLPVISQTGEAFDFLQPTANALAIRDSFFVESGRHRQCLSIRHVCDKRLRGME